MHALDKNEDNGVHVAEISLLSYEVLRYWDNTLNGMSHYHVIVYPLCLARHIGATDSLNSS